jgi:hypothetical protein
MFVLQDNVKDRHKPIQNSQFVKQIIIFSWNEQSYENISSTVFHIHTHSFDLIPACWNCKRASNKEATFYWKFILYGMDPIKFRFCELRFKRTRQILMRARIKYQQIPLSVSSTPLNCAPLKFFIQCKHMVRREVIKNGVRGQTSWRLSQKHQLNQEKRVSTATSFSECRGRRSYVLRSGIFSSPSGFVSGGYAKFVG